MPDHLPTAVLVQQIAENGHDGEMCDLVAKMSSTTGHRNGKKLGEEVITLIEKRYEANQNDLH